VQNYIKKTTCTNLQVFSAVYGSKVPPNGSKLPRVAELGGSQRKWLNLIVCCAPSGIVGQNMAVCRIGFLYHGRGLWWGKQGSQRALLEWGVGAEASVAFIAQGAIRAIRLPNATAKVQQFFEICKYFANKMPYKIQIFCG